MAFKFEDLSIWNKAWDLTIQVNELVKTFPSYELYNLSNQIRRASDSVGLNIAEGSTPQSDPEFNRFPGYAMRSAIEVVSALLLQTKKYIGEKEYRHFYGEYETLYKMIRTLRNTLRAKS